MSHFTRNIKSYGRGTGHIYKTCARVGCENQFVTTGLLPGSSFTKRQKYCSQECSRKVIRHIARSRHNLEMKQASHKKLDESRHIFNSPFRSKQ